MKHLGDITKLKGDQVPLVDIVCGGSPCQDLSCAGLRKGLQHSDKGDEETTRSGLFMDQIRIIKEMRNECIRQLQMRRAAFDIRCVRPRYMVWENVCGALSSPGKDKKGQDFRCVLEEVCRIADKTATVPLPEGGKWSTSGCIMGYTEQGIYSVAWSVHDAQFWGKTITNNRGEVVKKGTPQRRRRVALVADFGGPTAPNILFEKIPSVSDSMYRNLEESPEEREKASGVVREGTDSSSFTLKIRGGREIDSSGKRAGKGPLVQEELSGTLGVSQDQTLITIQKPSAISIDEKMGNTYVWEEVGNTLAQRDYKQPQAVVYGIGSYESNAMKSDNPNSGIYLADTSRTLDINGGNPACNQGGMIVIEGNGSRDSHLGDGFKESEVSYTLNTVEQHGVCYGIDRAAFNQGENALYDFSVEEETAQTLMSKGPGGVLTQ